MGTRFPTEAHAQDAEMSLAEYEEFVYAACHWKAGRFVHEPGLVAAAS